MGKKSEFSLPQLLILFVVLDKSAIGRYKLANYLDTSLAKTRALLNILVKKSLAITLGQSSGRTGTRLTKKGKNIAQLIKAIMFFDFEGKTYDIPNNLIPKGENIVLGLLNIDNSKTKGVYERDLAVRYGANGAITLIKYNDSWIFPDDKEKTKASFQIKHKNLLNSYNTVVLVFGNQIGNCCVGAATIASYYLEDQLYEIFSDHFEE